LKKMMMKPVQCAANIKTEAFRVHVVIQTILSL